jgi:hypothetical protein
MKVKELLLDVDADTPVQISREEPHHFQGYVDQALILTGFDSTFLQENSIWSRVEIGSASPQKDFFKERGVFIVIFCHRVKAPEKAAALSIA